MLLAIDTMSDEELLVEYGLTHSNLYFTELYDRYFVPLFGMFWQNFPSLADQRDDLMQEVWQTVHLKYAQYERGNSVNNWIFTIAQNVAKMKLRDDRRQKRYTGIIDVSLDMEKAEDEVGDETGPQVIDEHSTAADPSDICQNEDIMQRMRDSMDRLPEPLRKAVELVYFEGLDYRTAAARLGRTKSTVKRRVNEALALMREELT